MTDAEVAAAAASSRPNRTQSISDDIAIDSRRRITGSIAWLMADKGAQLMVGGVVTALVIRALGPLEYGRFALATGMFGLVMTFTVLGQGSVTRELALTTRRRDEDVIVATALVLAGLASLAATVVLALLAFLPNENVSNASPLILVLCLALLVRPLWSVDYWFQAHLRTRVAATTRLLGLMLTSAAKVVAVVLDAPLITFAWLIVLEHAVIGSLLAAGYVRASRHRERHWRIRRAAMLRLARESLPLIVAGFSIAIYARLDRFLLGILSSEEQVGFYSASAMLVEVSYMLPMVVCNVLLPVMSRLYVRDRTLFLARTEQFFSFFLWAGVLVSVCGWAFGGRLALLLFGDRFAGTSWTLRVLSLSVPFVFLGVAQGVWTIQARLQREYLYKTVMGAALNTGLNILILPVLGAVGAAWTTVIATAYAAVLGNFIHPRTRAIGRAQLRAVNPLVLFALVRSLARKPAVDGDQRVRT